MVSFSTGAPFAHSAKGNLSRSGPSRQPAALASLVAADEIAETAKHPAEVALDVLAVTLVGRMDAVGEAGKRQRLEPHAARSGQCGEEQAFPAEQRGLD